MVVIGRATIIGVIMLLAPALGQAQLADCQVLGSGSQTYKVVMDELSLAGGATAGSAAATACRARPVSTPTPLRRTST